MDQWLETKQLPVHFVSAAGVVYKEGKVLLIRSERSDWEFPGAKPGATAGCVQYGYLCNRINIEREVRKWTQKMYCMI